MVYVQVILHLLHLVKLKNSHLADHFINRAKLISCLLGLDQNWVGFQVFKVHFDELEVVALVLNLHMAKHAVSMQAFSNLQLVLVVPVQQHIQRHAR